jgi:hypothetical protein
VIYLIGSLRNPYVPLLAKTLRNHGHEVFDDWHAPGPETDDFWQEYEERRGRTYREAINAPHAWTVFRFDKLHLDRADTVVLVLPAGKSGHLEFGYSIGMGKKGIIYFDKEPERWDVMYRFATDIAFSEQELIEKLNGN